MLGNAGATSLYCNNGGSYTFTHATIANYWTKGFRSSTALQIDNNNGQDSYNLYKADFLNCIIDGNNSSELRLFKLNNDSLFNFSFSNCMLKVDTAINTPENSLYDFNDKVNYKLVFLNQNASFLKTSQHNFSINEDSFAIGKANLEGVNFAPKDILGLDRTTNSAIGAYQYIFIDK